MSPTTRRKIFRVSDSIILFGLLLVAVLVVKVWNEPQYSSSDDECQTFTKKYVSAEICPTHAQITNIGDTTVSVEIVLRAVVPSDDEQYTEKTIDAFPLSPRANATRSSLFLSDNRILNVYDASNFVLLETIDLGTPSALI